MSEGNLMAKQIAADILILEELVTEVAAILRSNSGKAIPDILHAGLDVQIDVLRKEVGKRIAQKYNDKHFPKPKREGKDEGE
jgi:S-adenosylmethionine synthetase